jgi:hypothetical protein
MDFDEGYDDDKADGCFFVIIIVFIVAIISIYLIHNGQTHN